MAEQQAASAKEELKRIYEDATYFVNAITSEYGFYGAMIEAMREGGARLKVNRRMVKKTIEAHWVEAIEACLPALDTAIRMPSRAIEEQEEVLPIEFSHNITSRSIRHLAQHTDYINKIEKDGSITPSKILNVYNEETNLTYENKFIHTLIQRLYIFLDRRYSALKEQGMNQTDVVLDFSSDFKLGNSNGKIHVTMESSDPGELTEEQVLFNRLERLYQIVTRYMESEFVKSMGQNYVRPPIMRTNAITKNKNLRQCLDLWDFIESYEKIGYTLEVEEQAERPDDGYIGELYAMLSLQYMVFAYNLQHGFQGAEEILDKRVSEEPLTPELQIDLKPVEAQDFNVHDSEYRHIVNVQYGGASKALSAGERQIKAALEAALEAEKIKAAQRIAAIQEEKRNAAAEEKRRREAALRAKKKERECQRLKAQALKERALAQKEAQKKKEQEALRLKKQKEQEREAVRRAKERALQAERLKKQKEQERLKKQKDHALLKEKEAREKAREAEKQRRQKEKEREAEKHRKEREKARLKAAAVKKKEQETAKRRHQREQEFYRDLEKRIKGNES